MKEILLTSSALILALLVLRRVFRKRISRRLQYALWGLVLLRLLVPANLPAVDFSVLSVTQPARTQVEERLEQEPVYVLPVERVEFSATKPQEPTVIFPLEGRYTGISERGDAVFLTRYAFTLEEAWDLVWKTGIAAMALWLAASNLGFWVKLRRRRIPLELPDCKYPAYLVEEGLVSPCLFGLFRPAVYLTPAALESPDGLRHVLAHEETHARHLDPLWSLLRSVCLAAYWFDPLVWWAAAASREDCELACDEGALKRLGEEERIPYGRTLLRLIPVRRSVGGALVTATTMTSDKKRLKDRITRIAENRKMKAAALCAVLAVTAPVCVVTFTGSAAGAEPAPAEPASPVEAVDTPASPVLPEDPSDSLAIPLTDLEPYAPAPVEVRPADRLYAEDLHESHHEDHHDGYSPPFRMGGGCRTTEGASTFAWCLEDTIYVSSQDDLLSSFPGDYFLSFSMQDYYEEEFTGLFGYDGVRISYFAERSDSYYCTFNDYYVFAGEPDGGTSVFLLARVYGEPQLIDLDGDGVQELVGSSYDQAQLFFQRDGELYQADLGPLLTEHWKRWEEGTWLSNAYDFYGWDAGGRYLYLSGYVPAATSSGMETSLLSFRRLYFDGTDLLLYKPERRISDHVLMMDETLRQPEPVLTAATELAKASYEQWASGYSGDIYRPAAEWDNYCVTGIEYVYPTESGQLPEGVNLAVYNVSCEFHSPTPADVMPAGETWVDEDGWVGGM